MLLRLLMNWTRHWLLECRRLLRLELLELELEQRQQANVSESMYLERTCMNRLCM
jgi:hypothetical protein